MTLNSDTYYNTTTCSRALEEKAAKYWTGRSYSFIPAQTPHRDSALSEAELLSAKTFPTGERTIVKPLHLTNIS